MFCVGFLDDLRINIKPFKRLLIMVIVLFASIYFLPIKILNLDIPFLKSLQTIIYFHQYSCFCASYLLLMAQI